MNLPQYNTIVTSMLLSDAHAMPLHWNYDNESIANMLKNKQIDLDSLNSGEVSDYYKEKEKGELSHHGDQIYHLYQYIKKNESFDIRDYTKSWKEYITQYRWYKDSSTKSTLEKIEFDIFPSGADSSDFCGVAMGIPLLLYELENRDKAKELILSRSTMTHNNTLTSDTTVWLLNTLFEITSGQSVMSSMDMSAEKINNAVFQEIYEKGKSLISRKESIQELIKEVGLGCGIEVNLPIVLVLIGRHHTNYLDFIKKNTRAGADASSRALVGGAIIGAKKNIQLPENLLRTLQVSIV